MVIRFYQGWFQMLLIDFPLFMASTFSISSFYLVSQKELYPKTWYKTFLYLPFLMSLGIGLTVTNTRAVLEALFGIKSSFKRTPKYRVEKKGEKSQAAKYRKRLGIVPWIELLIGCYFALTIWYAFITKTTSPCHSCCSSLSATGIPGCCRSFRDVLSASASAAPTQTSLRQSHSRLGCDAPNDPRATHPSLDRLAELIPRSHPHLILLLACDGATVHRPVCRAL